MGDVVLWPCGLVVEAVTWRSRIVHEVCGGRWGRWVIIVDGGGPWRSSFQLKKGTRERGLSWKEKTTNDESVVVRRLVATSLSATCNLAGARSLGDVDAWRCSRGSDVAFSCCSCGVEACRGCWGAIDDDRGSWKPLLTVATRERSVGVVNDGG